MRFQYFLYAVLHRYTNSRSSCDCFWLEYDQEFTRKLLRSVSRLESTCNLENSFWILWEIFNIEMLVHAQLFCLGSLGLSFWVSIETIRSTNLVQIPCNYGLRYLILWKSFSIFFMLFLFNHDPILSQLTLII